MCYVESDPTNLLGAMDITTDSDNIYVLYNEQIESECTRPIQTNKILVFDWNGKPVKIINVDCQIKSIRYSKLTKSLVGLNIDDKGDYSFYELVL